MPTQLTAIANSEHMNNIAMMYLHDSDTLQHGILDGTIPSATADNGATSSIGTKRDSKNFLRTPMAALRVHQESNSWPWEYEHQHTTYTSHQVLTRHPSSAQSSLQWQTTPPFLTKIKSMSMTKTTPTSPFCMQQSSMDGANPALTTSVEKMSI